jgi:hypothetical protein
LGGTRPSACIDLLKQENIAAVYGNTDEEVGQDPLLSDDIEAEKAYNRTHVDSMLEWIRAQLSEADRAWLRELPFYRRISPTVNPKDDLFVVHANPHDVEQHIYPPENRQKELFGEIVQADDDADLAHMLGDLEVGVKLPENLENFDWSVTTWEGSRREQLRRWSQLPLAQVIAAIEEMEVLSDQLHRDAHTNPEPKDG